MGERLFFLGTTNNGRLPFGIHLQSKDVKMLVSSIRPSSTVIWNEATEELFFENAKMIVHLKSGVPYSNLINKQSDKVKLSPLQLEEFINILVTNGEKTGLDIDIGQFIIDYLSDKQIEQNDRTVVVLYHLMNALFSNDVNKIESVIRYFLGRGKGLTPSGDDHFVGLLAIHTVFNVFSPVFLQTLQKIIELESVTTDIGKEYLMYALKGEFSSSVVNIINNLQEENHQLELKKQLGQLLTMGHSSGVDTAFGMLIGLLALKREVPQS
ncbi:DUF2877 domain-containing protein [Bacillus sp. Bva_UNVM-123]|uniref:DUF2877 domain-containing protein n=1 Tax=Bacillus sp. Bva_UNVM-123 TaxID=2829798 RepID=UPI00391F0570